MFDPLNPLTSPINPHVELNPCPKKESGRKRAAPHIKTYIRYGNRSHESIDWALVTSANLSKQAWGEAVSSAGEVRIQSYEIGVLVWPELYGGEGARMEGVFCRDSLEGDDGEEEKGENEGDGVGKGKREEKEVTVALRVPYSLPLQAYGRGEVPWVATEDHTEPDWMGMTWEH